MEQMFQGIQQFADAQVTIEYVGNGLNSDELILSDARSFGYGL